MCKTRNTFLSDCAFGETPYEYYESNGDVEENSSSIMYPDQSKVEGGEENAHVLVEDAYFAQWWDGRTYLASDDTIPAELPPNRSNCDERPFALLDSCDGCSAVGISWIGKWPATLSKSRYESLSLSKRVIRFGDGGDSPSLGVLFTNAFSTSTSNQDIPVVFRVDAVVNSIPFFNITPPYGRYATSAQFLRQYVGISGWTSGSVFDLRRWPFGIRFKACENTIG